MASTGCHKIEMAARQSKGPATYTEIARLLTTVLYGEYNVYVCPVNYSL